MSDATAAKSTATSDERVRSQKRQRPPQHLHRNSGPSALNRLTARFQRSMQRARPQGGKIGGKESLAVHLLPRICGRKAQPLAETDESRSRRFDASGFSRVLAAHSTAAASYLT